MVSFPQPVAPTSSYTAAYDAWNQLVSIASAGSTISQYQYDGLKRTAVKNQYSGGVLTENRHYYHSATWQVIEERVGSSSTPNRQFVWGIRYQDDMLLRDRDSTGGGVLSERLYAFQDPNWNVTATADNTGTVQERYAYTAYGAPTVLTPGFQVRSSSNYAWETGFAGYRLDAESGVYRVRNRIYHALLGSWFRTRASITWSILTGGVSAV